MCISRVHKTSISKMVSYNYCDNNLAHMCALGSILNMLSRKINKMKMYPMAFLHIVSIVNLRKEKNFPPLYWNQSQAFNNISAS